VLVIPMPGKKVLEHGSGLRPSEKEVPEQCSSVFRHKNTSDFTTYDHYLFPSDSVQLLCKVKSSKRRFTLSQCSTGSTDSLCFVSWW
jgi:hypothetical protein